MRRVPIALFAAGLAWASAAAAQEAPDPIGDILSAPAAAPAPTPAPAAPPATEAPPAPAPFTLQKPQWPAPRPTPQPPPAGAIHVEDVTRTPDSPLTSTDLNYEARLRASFQAAERMQGPLDGRWVIRSGSERLYDLQLVDKSSGVLEGVWLDPRRSGATSGSGFIDQIARADGRLSLEFQARQGADPVKAQLSPGAGETWTGELTERGERRSVTMSRN